MDKTLHQQLYSGMPRHSIGGAMGAGHRTRQSSASSFGSSNTGRKSLGGSALNYGGAGGMKKSAGAGSGGGIIGQR